MPADIGLTSTTYTIGGFTVDRDIIRYIRDASDISGISFDYMMAKAGHESRFDSDAMAEKSTAEGIYQFTADTWLQQMKIHGAKYGYAKMANEIKRDKKGRYRVTDPEMRAEILALRRSPRLASLLAAEFAKSNKKILEDQIGGQITSVDLYLAHFMGPTGAVMLLRADKLMPNKRAADLFPDAAFANRPIFFNEKQKMRTVRQVKDVITNIFEQKIESFVVLPKTLNAWLEAQSSVDKKTKIPKDKKSPLVVQTPVLKITTTAQAVLQSAPVPKIARYTRVVKGEGINLDDDHFFLSAGKNDPISANIRPLLTASYAILGITELETQKKIHTLYTASDITAFEINDFIPTPVKITPDIGILNDT